MPVVIIKMHLITLEIIEKAYNALNIQWALLNGILDNVISLGSSSKSGFLKLPSFKGEGRSNNVIIGLLQSEIIWQKAIPLSGI